MARKRSLISVRNVSAVRDRRVSDFPPRNLGDAPWSDIREILFLMEWNLSELDIYRHARDYSSRILIAVKFSCLLKGCRKFSVTLIYIVNRFVETNAINVYSCEEMTAKSFNLLFYCESFSHFKLNSEIRLKWKFQETFKELSLLLSHKLNERTGHWIAKIFWLINFSYNGKIIINDECVSRI